MERKEINQLNMQKATYKVLDNNRAQFANNNLIVVKVEQLRALNDQIDALNEIQRSNTRGIYLVKGQLEIKLISLILIIKGGLLAHASITNNVKIKELASVTENSLFRLRDNDLLDTARVILSTSRPLINSLLIWGIAKSHIDDLESTITALSDAIANNAAIKAQAKQSTAEIKQKLGESRRLLKEQLDPVILPFQVINPAFYGEYIGARQIVNVAASHSSSNKTNSTPK